MKQKEAMREKNVLQQTENKMGVMPISKLVISMSLPVMISMLVQAFYNIVDSIFVAQIHEDALTAVSLAFSMQALMVGLGVGTSVGVNAVLSKALGEKNLDKVNSSAKHGIFLSVLCYLIFLLVGIFLTEAFYIGQTKDEAIVTYGKEYLYVVCCGSFGLFMQIMLEKLLQSTGRNFYTMITQGVGAIINIILDPILIFGLFGFPVMGVLGAGIATVVGQTVAAILALYFNLKKNEDIRLDFRGFRPDFDMMKQIYVVGFPSILIQVGGSLMVYGMNQILIVFSSTATAVFGVYYKLQSFIFMPVFGLNSGLMPIVAYNFGAGKRERVVKTTKLSVIYATIIMAVGCLAFQLIPGFLLRFFNASENMIGIGIPSLRIISISFLFAGFNIICGAMFGALGNGMYGMIIATARQLAVLVPVAYLLSRLGKVDFVWWAFPVAEVVAFVMTIIFVLKIYQKVIRHIGSGHRESADNGD